MEMKIYMKKRVEMDGLLKKLNHFSSVNIKKAIMLTYCLKYKKDTQKYKSESFKNQKTRKVER